MASWAESRPDTPTSDYDELDCARAPPPRPPLLPLADLQVQPLRTASLAGFGSAQTTDPSKPGDRVPLSPVSVPQPTSAPQGLAKRDIEAKKNHEPGEHMASCGAPEELSTMPPSSSASVSCRSPRQCTARPTSRGGPCRSLVRPTSPRSRMSDVFHGQNSVIMYPELQRRNRSPVNSRGGIRFTTPLLSPRNLAGDGYPRPGLAASNDCLQWLRQCQSDALVEDLVDDTLADEQEPRRLAEYKFARDNLRTPSYRNATKCATSMARRTKTAPVWR